MHTEHAWCSLRQIRECVNYASCRKRDFSKRGGLVVLEIVSEKEMESSDKGSKHAEVCSILTPDLIAGFNKKLKGLDELAHVKKSRTVSPTGNFLEISLPRNFDDTPNEEPVNLMSYLDSLIFIPTNEEGL